MHSVYDAATVQARGPAHLPAPVPFDMRLRAADLVTVSAATHPPSGTAAPPRAVAPRLATAALLTFALVALAGCSTARDPALALVRVRASKDLDCPTKQLEVDSTWGGRYRVVGCGRAATYDSACSGLQCSVSRQGEQPTPWMGRPDPHSPLGDR